MAGVAIYGEREQPVSVSWGAWDKGVTCEEFGEILENVTLVFADGGNITAEASKDLSAAEGAEGS